tara:strand:+ start:1717 stop:2403 length:687 start_codon:yes stop_codon:yes gene_type:complete
MSSRRTLNQTEGSKNPATKFLKWKSNDKSFSYYDKAKAENVEVPLPFKFQFLEHFHTIKGWNDASESGVYSNEVKFISKETLKVRSFKGGDIAEGLYTDIRGNIRDAGGKYFRSVYVISDEGEIINLQFKGAVVSAYSDFMSEHENQVEGSWIVINKAEDKKKGATKYSVPIFEIGKAFTKDEMALADEKYQDIVAYFDKYTSKDVKEIEVDVDTGTLDMASEVDLDF